MESSPADKAIKSTASAKIAYCKFITANDVGANGSHQAGFYINMNAYQIAFDTPQKRGSNNENVVKIRWNDGVITTSRFIYYGTRTRNEYRLTRARPELNKDEYIGSLLVLAKIDSSQYEGFVLNNDEEIDSFLEYYSLSPQNAAGILHTTRPDNIKTELLLKYADGFGQEFPPSIVLSEAAREIYNQLSPTSDLDIINNPDKIITEWVDLEYELFKVLESIRYQDLVSNPFESVEDLIIVANTVLNRRKSRAGKSLENHLSKVFDINDLPYSDQKVTEGKKKPDFIIPSISDYHNASYSNSKLIFLGAKTTCKDRWRQVLNEAERIPHKHLFTLQQGISSAQMDEMAEENLILVVPEQNKPLFPREHQHNLLGLGEFIAFAKDTIRFRS